MRFKTVPRRRRTNYLYQINNANREQNIRSTVIMQDVQNREFMKIKEYSQILDSVKKPEANRIELPGTSGYFDSTKFVAGRYIKELNFFNCDVRSFAEDSFGAMNLSIKNRYRIDGNNDSSNGNEFAGSLLYQIMTDPTFVNNIRNNKEMKKLTCEFCKKIFANYNELQNHLDSLVNRADRIACCACGKTFRQKRYLRYHQRCHVMNNKFTCEICTKKYSRLDNLTRHKTHHTNPDKYPCNFCKKTFSRKDLMTKHFKSHLGKKDSCNICKKVFANFEEMKAHIIGLHCS